MSSQKVRYALYRGINVGMVYLEVQFCSNTKLDIQIIFFNILKIELLVTEVIQ